MSGRIWSWSRHTSGGVWSANVMFIRNIRCRMWYIRVRGKVDDWRSDVLWNWSRRKLSRHDIGFGNTARNWEPGIVVCSTSPQITRPGDDIGTSNEIVEGASWKVVDPGKQ